ncbi:MAG TPA: O-antigen ligase family protein, partial [Desulfitobacteriaceae bacterium]|nr:O-antigen ligase family protein [Desulfitobacteriaceae bacterium]
DPNNINYLILGVLLIVPSYLRGLYYDQEALFFCVLIGVLGLFSLLFDPEALRKPLTLVDWGFLGLAVWYLIGIPFAVSTGDALLGATRYVAYALLYLVASRLLQPRIITAGAWLLALNGALLVLIAIGSKIQFPPLVAAWGTDLSSTFQYSNAFGGFLLMTIPVTLYLYLSSSSPRNRYFALSLLYLNVLGLMGTQSKGAYAIFFFQLVLLTISIVSTKNYKVLPVLIVLILAGSIAWNIVAWAGSLQLPSLPLWPLIGLPVIFLSESVSTWHYRRWLYAVALIAIIVLLIMYGPEFRSLLAPNNQENGVSQTIQSIDDVGDSSYQMRLVLYKDALEMALSQPLFGLGANGWKNAYKAFRDYGYIAYETHSGPLNILVESGFPGLGLYLLLWSGFLWKWLKARKDNNYIFFFGIAALGIGLHSLIDFDLSESAIFLVLILLMASVMCSEEPEQTDKIAGSRLNLITVCLFSGLLVTVPLALQQALLYYEAGRKASLADDRGNAINYFQAALRLNPFDAKIYAEKALSEIEYSNFSQDDKLAGPALADAQQTLRYSKLDPAIIRSMESVYFLADKPDQAYLLARQNLLIDSLDSQSYEEAANYAILYAQQLIDKGQEKEARDLLQGILELPAHLESRYAAVPSDQKIMWRKDLQLSITPLLKSYLEEAQAMLDNLQQISEKG